MPKKMDFFFHFRHLDVDYEILYSHISTVYSTMLFPLTLPSAISGMIIMVYRSNLVVERRILKQLRIIRAKRKAKLSEGEAGKTIVIQNREIETCRSVTCCRFDLRTNEGGGGWI